MFEENGKEECAAIKMTGDGLQLQSLWQVWVVLTFKRKKLKKKNNSLETFHRSTFRMTAPTL